MKDGILMNMIQINAAIFPTVMKIILGKPLPQDAIEQNTDVDSAPDLILDLPRSAYLTYLQSMAAKGESSELRLLKKYAEGTPFSDADYNEAISNILFIGERSNCIPSSEDLLLPFGICISNDGEKRRASVIDGEEERLRAETWEYILIDILRKSAFEIIECFNFDASFERVQSNNGNDAKLHYSLMAWRFSFDDAEQSLSNALRAAFIFTLVGYCYGDSKNNYASFQEYFDAEFYNRVSLIYGTWNNRGVNAKIQYIPLYDSFHNLSGNSKNDLIAIVKSILDDPTVAIDEKQTLKNRLIEGAGAIHNGISAADAALEQALVKPVVNFVILREKAKETIETVRILCAQGHYSDCANRCYYAMMYSLKALLEHKGLLADWKQNELKEPETHAELEKKLALLISHGVLSSADGNDFNYVKDQRWKCDYSLYRFGQSDAQSCLQKAEAFYATIERLTK